MNKRDDDYPVYSHLMLVNLGSQTPRFRLFFVKTY